MPSLTRTAIALLAVGAAALPLAGCGSDSAGTATSTPATATTAQSGSLAAATTALGAAAMSALQDLKGGVSTSNADAYVAAVTKAQAQFQAAVAQVKAAESRKKM